MLPPSRHGEPAAFDSAYGARRARDEEDRVEQLVDLLSELSDEGADVVRDRLHRRLAGDAARRRGVMDRLRRLSRDSESEAEREERERPRNPEYLSLEDMRRGDDRRRRDAADEAMRLANDEAKDFADFSKMFPDAAKVRVHGWSPL